MKWLILSILLSMIGNAQVIHDDKVLHMAAGGVIYVGCIIIGKELDLDVNHKWCLLPPLIVGIGKEIHDQNTYGGFDLEDIGATMFIPTTSFILYEW